MLQFRHYYTILTAVGPDGKPARYELRLVPVNDSDEINNNEPFWNKLLTEIAKPWRVSNV